jgi:hypothetical protein
LGKSDCLEACCEGLRQAILFEEELSDDELYCMGKPKNRSPKIICSLDLSLFTFFASSSNGICFLRDKESNWGVGQRPNRLEQTRRSEMNKLLFEMCNNRSKRQQHSGL